MGVDNVIGRLMRVLSEVSRDEPYLGVLPTSNFEDSTPLYYDGELEDCSPLENFAYLDTSSRTISVRGANIHMASLYANEGGKHIMVPTDDTVPFLAMKGSEAVITKVKEALGNVLATHNVNGVPYNYDYKDDNILDELRISLENMVINKSARPVIVDGPIVPGPYLQMVGEPYKSAFEELASRRNRSNLIGVVKRLNFTRKLSREENIKRNYRSLVGATDDVIVQQMGKGRNKFVTSVFKEEVNLKGATVRRYMVYVKLRDSVFRVESVNRELLCSGVKTSLNSASIRGIPTFIEVADKMSKRLSASVYVLSFIHASSLLGVNYEDWNTYLEASRDLGD
jgi:hypothetical protein